jgi:hypothetical protein
MKIQTDFNGRPTESTSSLGVLGQWHRVPEANSQDLGRNHTRLFSYPTPRYCNSE